MTLFERLQDRVAVRLHRVEGSRSTPAGRATAALQPEQKARAASVRIVGHDGRRAFRFTITAATRLPSPFAQTTLR